MVDCRQSSTEVDWPWNNAPDAQSIFQTTYPSVFEHMREHEVALRARKTSYRYWWELGNFGSWNHFSEPKLIYQEIQFHPSYALSERLHFQQQDFHSAHE